MQRSSRGVKLEKPTPRHFGRTPRASGLQIMQPDEDPVPAFHNVTSDGRSGILADQRIPSLARSPPASPPEEMLLDAPRVPT